MVPTGLSHIGSQEKIHWHLPPMMRKVPGTSQRSLLPVAGGDNCGNAPNHPFVCQYIMEDIRPPRVASDGLEAGNQSFKAGQKLMAIVGMFNSRPAFKFI